MNGRDISIAAIAVVLAFLGGMVVQGTAGDPSTEDLDECLANSRALVETSRLLVLNSDQFQLVAKVAMKEADRLREANIRLTHRLKVVSGAPDAWSVTQSCEDGLLVYGADCIDVVWDQAPSTLEWATRSQR